MGPVCVVGELLWDRFPHKQVLGGAPANVALRVHEQGCGVALVSRVGKDALGDSAVRMLSERGLDMRYVQRDGLWPTGVVDVQIDARGDAHYTICKDMAYDALEATPEVLELVSGASVLCFGTLVQRGVTSALCVERMVQSALQATVLVDVNLRAACYTQESVFRSVGWADVVKLNGEEALLLASWLGWAPVPMDVLCASLRRHFGLHTCVITLGADGGVACDAQGAVASWKAPVVQVVDTVGAGDAFTAGYIVSFVRGASLQQSCEMGAVMGSRVAAVSGGMSAIGVV